VAETGANSAEYEDHPSILDGELLWRRIPPWHIVEDKNMGRLRPSTGAFEDEPGTGHPMSVGISSLCPNGPADMLVGFDGFALVQFTARFARDLGLLIVSDPQPGEPWHALVGKKTKTVKKAFARLSDPWIIPPPTNIAGK